jgi:GMP synthase PP-ATPase subunit
MSGLPSSFFLSAKPYAFDFASVPKTSIRLINEVDGITRVTYEIASKPPGTWSEELPCKRPET